MNKLKLNILIDVVSFFVFLIVLVSSLVLDFGALRAGQQAFLGIARKDWASLHRVFGYAFLFLVFAHLVLHFNFVKRIPELLRKQCK